MAGSLLLVFLFPLLSLVNAEVYQVAVGKDGLNFTPPIVNAQPGDYIDFTL